jgi:hypothetical protein
MKESSFWTRCGICRLVYLQKWTILKKGKNKNDMVLRQDWMHERASKARVALQFLASTFLLGFVASTSQRGWARRWSGARSQLNTLLIAPYQHADTL